MYSTLIHMYIYMYWYMLSAIRRGVSSHRDRDVNIRNKGIRKSNRLFLYFIYLFCCLEFISGIFKQVCILGKTPDPSASTLNPSIIHISKSTHIYGSPWLLIEFNIGYPSKHCTVGPTLLGQWLVDSSNQPWANVGPLSTLLY